MRYSFEIDPNLVADAVREGYTLHVEVTQGRTGIFKKVTLGQRSPHVPYAARMAKR